MLLAAATAVTMSLSSTAYCLPGVMANGQRVRTHSVAMNGVPLGTKIKLIKPKSFYGVRNFVVRDRIGHGTQLDFWTRSCGTAIKYGRKQVVVKVTYPKKRR